MNNILTYILIFSSKIIENALATLRLIVVANGKKVLGAILQLCISLVWILVTGIVINNLTKDILKIVFFAFGSLVGSYIGSFIEEKMALGYNLITYVTNDNDNTLYNTLARKNYNFINLNCYQKNTLKEVFFITVPRKKTKHIFNIIREYDSKATIISELIEINSVFDNKGNNKSHDHQSLF